jgi:hypothetical protein
MARVHQPDQPGFAVRIDWPVAGSAAVCHDFARFTTSLRRAARRAEGTRRFWARGPLRPLAVTVVPIGRDTFRAHAPECLSPDCPTAASLLGMDADRQPQHAAGSGLRTAWLRRGPTPPASGGGVARPGSCGGGTA